MPSFFAYSWPMPWKIEQSGNQFCVVKSADGTVVKCHPTRDAALRHQRALYVNEPKAWEQFMARLTAQFDDDNPFGEMTVQVAGREFRCAVARTVEQKTRGMIGRTFDGFDAMLFCYDEPVDHEFHMRGVDVQLHIAWFDAAGSVVDHVTMNRQDSWTYRPRSSFKWALEFPVTETDTNDWSWLDGAVLTL